jgi:UDP-N-acetylmuramate dehydrogenase
MFPDLIPELTAAAPDIRGRLVANAPLSDVTWLRVGGPAQVLYSPADVDDLAGFLDRCPRHIPITVIGVGSNLLVRDGGVPGVVIRLGRGFNEIRTASETEIAAGAAVPDVRLAQAAADAGIAGLAFYRGIPGSVGGALRMNAGAHGRETREVVKQVRGVSRDGAIHVYSNAEMGFVYRSSGIAPDVIFLDAVFECSRGDPAEIRREMQDVADYREAHQPIKSRTGGSTFKNPPGQSAWKLIDTAGCRGLRVGGAHMSEMHCNFLINDQNATAADIETLGETVRRRVFETSGIELEWEIKRIGIDAPQPVRRAAE